MEKERAVARLAGASEYFPQCMCFKNRRAHNEMQRGVQLREKQNGLREEAEAKRVGCVNEFLEAVSFRLQHWESIMPYLYSVVRRYRARKISDLQAHKASDPDPTPCELADRLFPLQTRFYLSQATHSIPRVCPIPHVRLGGRASRRQLSGISVKWRQL